MQVGLEQTMSRSVPPRVAHNFAVEDAITYGDYLLPEAVAVVFQSE